MERRRDFNPLNSGDNDNDNDLYPNYEESVLNELNQVIPHKTAIKPTILNPFTLSEIVKGHVESNDVYCTNQIIRKLNDDKVADDIAKIAEDTYFKYVFSTGEREYIEVFPEKNTPKIEPYKPEVRPFTVNNNESIYKESFRKIVGELIDGYYKYVFSSEDGEIITGINDIKSVNDAKKNVFKCTIIH